jgi:release factor glutamine methyltransferase
MPFYEPQEDSELLRIFVEKLARGDVLDMGTGSGILAFAAAKQDDVRSVLAIDLEDDALAHVKNQLRGRHDFLKKIRTQKSDLFADISRDERFDTIIFNPPYLPNEPGDAHPALYGGPGGWELIERLLSDAKSHLKPGGIILLLFSSLTNKERVIQFMKREGYQCRELAMQAHFFEQLYVYELWRST